MPDTVVMPAIRPDHQLLPAPPETPLYDALVEELGYDPLDRSDEEES